MNKFYNIRYPEFINKYGEDWSGFKSIVDRAVDIIIEAIFQIRNEHNINTMSERVVDIHMRVRGITIDSSDTLLDKKIKLRTFVSKHQKKGLDVIYLDIAEEIVGTRGVIYLESAVGGRIWGQSVWPDPLSAQPNEMSWTSDGYLFRVYIDVKTLDNGELDNIKRLYLDPTVRPSYYKIFLIDSDFNILRTVE